MHPVFIPLPRPSTFSFSASRGECCARFSSYICTCVRRSGSNSIVCKIKITGECSFVHKCAHNLYLHTHQTACCKHVQRRHLCIRNWFSIGSYLTVWIARSNSFAQKTTFNSPERTLCLCIFARWCHWLSNGEHKYRWNAPRGVCSALVVINCIMCAQHSMDGENKNDEIGIQKVFMRRARCRESFSAFLCRTLVLVWTCFAFSGCRALCFLS